MTELEQATSEELKNELSKRFPGLVIATLKVSDEDPSTEDFDFTFYGGMTTALGMVDRVYRQLRKETARVEFADE